MQLIYRARRVRNKMHEKKFSEIEKMLEKELTNVAHVTIENGRIDFNSLVLPDDKEDYLLQVKYTGMSNNEYSISIYKKEQKK